MKDDAGFLSAIRAGWDDGAKSDDDTVRLVYADWLDERSDPRGEYLRLEVEICQRQRDNLPVGPELLARHLELEGEIDWKWVGKVNRVIGDPRSPRIYPWFWRLLESASRNLRTLIRHLEVLPEERLRQYHEQFEEAKDYINPSLREVYHPFLSGGCSGDHGDDFSAWVVMEGREFYERLRAHPEQVAQYFEMYDAAHQRRGRKGTNRAAAGVWDCEVDRPEYEGSQRADYIVHPIYLARFGRELEL
jgi:uncharacterized protein (TIGR02996 family)